MNVPRPSPRTWTWPLLLVLIAGLLTAQPGFGQAATREAGEGNLISRKTDELCRTASTHFQDRLDRLATWLNSRGLIQLQIKAHFYDPELRRVFVEFAGKLRFTGKWPGKIKREEMYFTSDGDIAYDLTISHITQDSSGVRFEYQGNLVVFFDKILYDLAKSIPHLVGAAAFSAAGNVMIEFWKGLNHELLGQAISDTCAKFSLDYLSTITAEVLSNVSAPRRQALREVLQRSMHNGGVLHFFVVTVLKSVGKGVANFAGASAGAVVGNFLVPGAGGVVGAYLGSKLVSTLAKTAVYSLAVDLPIEVFLKKMVKHHERLQQNPQDPVAREKLAGYGGRIFTRVKREVDQNVFKTFDELLKKMDGCTPAERQAFIGLLQDIRELLRFRLTEQKDWYAAKKMNQMRVQLEKWGIFGRFPF
ncbi:MAG: hypothetical protein GX442_23315 [Candidatus Riflebacteria bacterium]|nr:hypothetical protein [Candidatus Riflebacteria bacterium]